MLAALVAALAGVVRGITGFGGAMVMAPPLALLLGPRLAVPVVLLLESFAAAPQVVQTRGLVRWRVVGPILVATCITVPLGGYVLLAADPLWLRSTKSPDWNRPGGTRGRDARRDQHRRAAGDPVSPRRS
jgi:uncharacterized membrane protein YfcA